MRCGRPLNASVRVHDVRSGVGVVMRAVQVTLSTLVLTLRVSAGDLSDSTTVNAEIKPGRSSEERSCEMWVPRGRWPILRGGAGDTEPFGGSAMGRTGRDSSRLCAVGTRES